MYSTNTYSDDMYENKRGGIDSYRILPSGVCDSCEERYGIIPR